MRRLLLGMVTLLAFGFAIPAQADWVLTPYLAGGTTTTSKTVVDNEDFSIDFYLTAAPGDLSTGVLSSALLDVGFSAGGLQYTGYTWNGGGGWGAGFYDSSIPSSGSFPVTVAAGSTSAHLENFTPAGFTLPGAFVTLNFHVPTGYSVPSTLITPLPDSLTDDLGDEIITVSGGSFNVITNVPEPSTWAMMFTGGAAALGCVVVRRRRQQAAVAKAA